MQDLKNFLSKGLHSILKIENINLHPCCKPIMILKTNNHRKDLSLETPKNFMLIYSTVTFISFQASKQKVTLLIDSA